MANDIRSPGRAWRLVVLAWLLAAAALLTAHLFERVGGYIPCAACYGQRVVYNVALPVMAALLVGAACVRYALAVRTLIAAAAAVGAAAFAHGAWLATVHAGAESGLWGIGGACGTSYGAINADDYVARIMATPFVDCLTPSLRILGLSFAGWNGVVSLVVAGLCATAFRANLTPSTNAPKA